jgi:hypothetical protein
MWYVAALRSGRDWPSKNGVGPALRPLPFELQRVALAALRYTMLKGQPCHVQLRERVGGVRSLRQRIALVSVKSPESPKRFGQIGLYGGEALVT